MGHKIKSVFNSNSSIPAADCSKLKSKDHADPVQKSSVDAVESVASCTDRNILLVSDDDRQRSLLRAYLQHVGFNVFSCADLNAALRMLALHRALRLVLVDNHLLATSASQLGKSFAEYCAEVPIFAITGRSAMDGTLRAVKHQVWEPDAQPLRLPDLLGRIQAFADGQADLNPPRADPTLERGPVSNPMPTVPESHRSGHLRKGSENTSSREKSHDAPMVAALPAFGR